MQLRLQKSGLIRRDHFVRPPAPSDLMTPHRCEKEHLMYRPNDQGPPDIPCRIQPSHIRRPKNLSNGQLPQRRSGDGRSGDQPPKCSRNDKNIVRTNDPHCSKDEQDRGHRPAPHEPQAQEESRPPDARRADSCDGELPDGEIPESAQCCPVVAGNQCLRDEDDPQLGLLHRPGYLQVIGKRTIPSLGNPQFLKAFFPDRRRSAPAETRSLLFKERYARGVPDAADSVGHAAFGAIPAKARCRADRLIRQRGDHVPEPVVTGHGVRIEKDEYLSIGRYDLQSRQQIVNLLRSLRGGAGHNQTMSGPSPVARPSLYRAVRRIRF